jgi:hypothetical protein
MTSLTARWFGPAALLVAAQGALAHQRLHDVRSLSSGVIAESWSFSGATPTGGVASVVSASQFTVPVTAIVPVTSGWALDAYVAYAHGSVSVDRGGAIGNESLSLSGVNDAKLRLVGKLHGDNLMLTLGASLPSGTTALSPSELSALSVLASPALRFRTPTLGNGASGTGGLVVAGQKGSWALAMAGSFEKRADYAPAEALTSGLGRPALQAGDAIHVSFGADRLLEAARQSFSIIGDFSTNGSLRDPSATVSEVGFRLGPSITATYQTQAAFEKVESMLYVLGRYRGNYSVGGVTVDDSWRAETEIGLVNAIPVSPQLSVRAGLDSRFHTASSVSAVDQTISGFATAGIIAGGATLGLQYSTPGGAFVWEPFLRGQIGQLDFGGPVRHALGASAGLTLTARF